MPYFNESQLEQPIIALRRSDMKEVFDKTVNK
jgi:hypothetical protein